MSRTRTNNRDTDRQLGEMDYTLFQVERMADELRKNGVSIPGGNHPLPSETEAPQESEVTTSKSARSTIYLPSWLHKHRYDPAVMVIPITYQPKYQLINMIGFHGIVTCSSPGSFVP